MRLQLARRTELAVRILQLLGEGGRRKGGSLAVAVDSSSGFVAQVVRPLVALGWVRSVSGPAGGYELLVPLSAISLLQLIEASEGPTDDGRCVLEERNCRPAGPCAIHEAWVRARTSLTSSLAAVPLSSLPGSPDGPEHPPPSALDPQRQP